MRKLDCWLDNISLTASLTQYVDETMACGAQRYSRLTSLVEQHYAKVLDKRLIPIIQDKLSSLIAKAQQLMPHRIVSRSTILIREVWMSFVFDRIGSHISDECAMIVGLSSSTRSLRICSTDASVIVVMGKMWSSRSRHQAASLGSFWMVPQFSIGQHWTSSKWTLEDLSGKAAGPQGRANSIPDATCGRYEDSRWETYRNTRNHG